MKTYQKAFTFDLNLCTGCQACQIACKIENQTDAGLNWRTVHTFNRQHHPELPLFHLSLACNHCVDPPCLQYCPALAYRKEPATGAVLIDPDKCIGCHYCAWNCPYDAPQFNDRSGVMEKCTFCQHRLEAGQRPACIELCPTGALGFEHQSAADESPAIPGFTKTTIGPSIIFKPLRDNQHVPEMVPAPEYDPELLAEFKPQTNSKITLQSEWTLIVFTVIIPVLVALQTTQVLNPRLLINPYVFTLSAILGMTLSSMHLGKKWRAYRAILNWQHSWLSREIICFSIYVALAAAYLFFVPMSLKWGIAASFVGFVTLWCMDHVYKAIARETRDNQPNWLSWHSADTFLTGGLLVGIFALQPHLFFGLGGLKVVLWALRHFSHWRKKQFPHAFLNICRFIVGFLLPTFLWMSNPREFYPWLLIFVLIGEAIDRVLFYLEMEIITPARQMQLDFNHTLSSLNQSRRQT